MVLFGIKNFGTIIITIMKLSLNMGKNYGTMGKNYRTMQKSWYYSKSSLTSELSFTIIFFC